MHCLAVKHMQCLKSKVSMYTSMLSFATDDIILLPIAKYKVDSEIFVTGCGVLT